MRKATINDVATRISKLEQTLTSIPVREAPAHPHGHLFKESPRSPRTVIYGPHAAPLSTSPATVVGQGTGTAPASVGSPHPGGEILLEKGSSTQYFNEVLVSRVIGQVCRLNF